MRIWPFLLSSMCLVAFAIPAFAPHDFRLALACTAILVYSPFAQRSLMLMGAAGLVPRLHPGAD